MDQIRIRGGAPLKGQIPVSGAKNATLPLIAAALVSDETLSLSNVPYLADITSMASLLLQLGVEVNIDGGGGSADGRIMQLTARNIADTTAPYDLVRKMRASVLVLGPLLARCGLAVEGGFEPVEEPVQGIDIAVFPGGESVLGVGGGPPKCLPMGHFAGLREAVTLYAAVLRVGGDLDVALGGEAAEHFRHTGLTGLKRRGQARDRPCFAGQAGQVIEDDELGEGQIGAFEQPIHARHQELLADPDPGQDLADLFLGAHCSLGEFTRVVLWGISRGAHARIISPSRRRGAGPAGAAWPSRASICTVCPDPAPTTWRNRAWSSAISEYS